MPTTLLRKGKGEKERKLLVSGVILVRVGALISPNTTERPQAKWIRRDRRLQHLK